MSPEINASPGSREYPCLLYTSLLLFLGGEKIAVHLAVFGKPLRFCGLFRAAVQSAIPPSDVYKRQTHDRDTECPVGERYSEAWIEDTAYKAIGQMLTLVEKKAIKSC